MGNILVIDDSKTVVTAISQALKGEGYAVHTAENFISIPKVIDLHAPEVIVLDLNMPALSGEQVGRFLQRYNYQGKIIIYSGERPERLASTAQTLGASAWVSKEEPIAKLVEAIRTCLPLSPKLLSFA
jgi:two-component system response regulator EvgA